MLFIGLLFFVHSNGYAGDFEEGVKYFKAKEYQKAVKYFKQAEASGNKKASLFYNLGVSYYKLEQYKTARKYFLKSGKNSRFSQLSQYNLGLVALKQKKKNIALKWFFRASRHSGDPRITAIANKQIDKLKPGAGAKSSSGGLILAYGNDSNVLLLSDTSPSQKSDSYFETYLYGKIRFANAYHIGGSWYQRDYSDIDGGDYNELRLDGNYLFSVNAWKLEPGIALSESSLNTRDYLEIYDLQLKAKRNYNSDRLTLRYRYSDISARDNIYSYLEGNRHQARVEYFTKSAAGYLRYRYQLEINDRTDRVTKSYSPTRHDVRLRFKKKLAKSWTMKLEGQYRLSDYPAASGVSRSDKRLRAISQIDYKINKQWVVAGKVAYTDNNSNLNSEDFSRTDWQLMGRLRF